MSRQGRSYVGKRFIAKRDNFAITYGLCRTTNKCTLGAVFREVLKMSIPIEAPGKGDSLA